jgi:lipopolysaccharide transport system permease protein
VNRAMAGIGRIWRAANALVAPIANVRALYEGIAELWRHRALCLELARRDLGGQFAGQTLGSFWIIGHPLTLFGVYVFIFGVVMKVTIPASNDMPSDYTTYILSGLIPWIASQHVLARAPTTLIAHANLVKQVVFPMEVLPVGAVIAASIPLLVGLAVVLVRALVFGLGLPWTLLLLPVVIGLHAAFLLGITYLLAVVTPFFRDIKDLVGVMTVIGVYAVPAFYLPQWVPPLLQPFLYVNPFSYFVWMYQDVLYYGDIRHPVAWAVSLALASLSLAVGVRAFRKLKPYVANVL